MPSRHAPLIGTAGLALFLAACSFTDPLSGRDNGEGILLIDALSGFWKDARIVCAVEEHAPEVCSWRTADVQIDDVTDPGQVYVDWRKNDPTTIDVFAFGGRIVRCRPASRTGGIRIRLWQLPLERRPSSAGWQPDTTPRLFVGRPNRCTTPD